MAHTHSKLIYHCIFCPQGRRLFDYFGGIFRNHEAHLLAIGGTQDHVHLLVELNASTPIAETMRTIKAVSSKWIHESCRSCLVSAGRPATAHSA